MIVDQSRHRRGRTAITCGVVIGGIGAIFTLVVVSVAIRSPATLAATLCSVPVAIGGVTLFARGRRNLQLSRWFGTPTLIVPSGQRLYLGGVVPARFQRVGGQGHDWSSAVILAELVCIERVRYTQGTDTHTVSREIGRQRLVVIPDRNPSLVSAQVQIGVPLTGPPSLGLPDNKIIWSVRVLVSAPGVPDDTSSFVLTVLPIVAAEVLR